MIPFFEPKVWIKNVKERESFDKIALKLGLSGYVIIGEKFEKKDEIKEKKYQFLNHISRFEI